MFRASVKKLTKADVQEGDSFGWKQLNSALFAWFLFAKYPRVTRQKRLMHIEDKPIEGCGVQPAHAQVCENGILNPCTADSVFPAQLLCNETPWAVGADEFLTQAADFD